jgi:hypothetical protein
VLTSSEQFFELHSGGAALAPETKTPAPSATAANVTTAPLMIVIVKPPYGNSSPSIVVGGAARRSDGEGGD